MGMFSASTENLRMNETWRERAKRAMKGRISQETLAERLGTSQPGLSHWLNDRSQPTLDDINRIADEIGVSRIWLTHGLGPAAGNGKLLLDLLMNEPWSDAELAPLAMMAQALITARRAGAATPSPEPEGPPAGEPQPLKPDPPLLRPGKAPKKLTGS